MKTSMLKKARDYIHLRRSMGYIFDTEAYYLESFGEYADKHAKGKPLTLRLALEWAVLPNGAKTYHSLRLSFLRPFARYLIVSDPRTELIPDRILGPCSSRVIPYIYSAEDISRLMNTPVYQERQLLANKTVSTIIGLLACSGLRIGEALSLKQADIDWKRNTIVVQWSKKLPSRLVPLDQSTMTVLRNYATLRDTDSPDLGHGMFFRQTNGNSTSYEYFRGVWRRLLPKSGVGKSHPRLPRTHDLRHTFACNHLLHAYEKKVDIDVAIHMLSIYLGHARLRETYWYLSVFQPLFETYGKQFEKYIKTCRKESNS